MKTHKVNAIVLNRTNYGEADKIATLLTSDGNKISVIAKGVRRPKSKLVAASELFVVSEVTYIVGKSKMHTVSSAKIIRQHTGFLNDLDKVQVAYDVLTKINKYTDDSLAAGYYNIILEVLKALESSDIEAKVVELWAWSRILQEAGHGLKLDYQVNDQDFKEGLLYGFDLDNGGFLQSDSGVYSPEHIKLLKIIRNNSLDAICRVKNCTNLSTQINPIVKQFIEISL